MFLESEKHFNKIKRFNEGLLKTLVDWSKIKILGMKKIIQLHTFLLKSLDLKNDFFIQKFPLNNLFQPEDLKKSFDS